MHDLTSLLQIGGKRHPRGPLARRFWSKVDRSGEHWLWQAAVDQQGYGTIRLVVNGRSVIVKAHRLAYLLDRGSLPRNLYVLHCCDIPACVRPDHLFIGTAADNSADMAAKGRAPMVRHPELAHANRGSGNGHSRLSEGQVAEIKGRRAAGETLTSLGARFGVHYTTIQQIVTGKTWRHVQAADAVLYVQGGQVEVRA
jgi:hypothetical protein